MPSNNTREDSTHGHHQMVNTEIRLIIFVAAKDGESLYSQQKQDRELTVAQIMNTLLIYISQHVLYLGVLNHCMYACDQRLHVRIGP